MIKPLLPRVLEIKYILRKEIPSHNSILSLKSNTLSFRRTLNPQNFFGLFIQFIQLDSCDFFH